VEQARYLAATIPGARLVEFPGDDHIPFLGDGDAIADEVEEFVTGNRHASDVDRVLATVLFTDIVRSTNDKPGWVTVLGKTSCWPITVLFARLSPGGAA